MAKKKRVLAYHLKVPIYPFEVFLTFSRDDYAEFLRSQKHFSENDIVYTLENSRGLVTIIEHEEENVFLVGVFDSKVSTVCHEITHVCMIVFENFGINPSDSSGEAFCYLQSYLVDWVLAIHGEDATYVNGQKPSEDAENEED